MSHLQDPTPEEMAAIIAAVELAWPRRITVIAAGEGGQPSPWRFSGRWWSRPITVRRDRPWPVRR